MADLLLAVAQGDRFWLGICSYFAEIMDAESALKLRRTAMLTVKPKSHPNWQLHSAAKTVCGTKHNHIEDYVLNEDSAGIFAVADGVGGYQGGAEASEFLCAVMTQELLETETSVFDLPTAKRVLRHAVSSAITGMTAITSACPELRHMGTTLALGWVVGNRLYYAHAGDSRLYLCRNQKLRRLTQDHSFVEGLRVACNMSDHDLRHHPYRNIITRSIGPASSDSRIDVASIPLALGDRLIFVTDGVTDFVDDETIRRLSNCTPSRDELCAMLLSVAKSAGAYDDLSAVVVDCDSRSQSESNQHPMPSWWRFHWTR